MNLRSELTRVAAVSVAMSCPFLSSSADTQPPVWADEVLGQIIYDPRGGRQARELGTVSGRDFLAIRPLDGKAYLRERMLEEGQPAGVQLEYRKQILVPRLAISILGRILDHEATKMKLEPEVHPELVEYIVRSVLVTYGLGLHRFSSGVRPEKTDWVMDERKDPRDPLPTTCHSSVAMSARPVLDEQGNKRHKPLRELVRTGDERVTPEQMYAWVLEAWKNRRNPSPGDHFRLSAEWDYVERGVPPPPLPSLMNRDLGKRIVGWPREQRSGLHLNVDPKTGAETVVEERLVDRSCRPLAGYRPVRVDLPSLPATLREFREAIRREMQAVYTTHMRAGLWDHLLYSRNKNLPWEAMFAVTADMLARTYEMHKGSALIAIPRQKAAYDVVSAEGPAAQAFMDYYLSIIESGQAEQAVKFAGIPRQQVLNDSLAALWAAGIADIRTRFQKDAYGKATLKFARDIVDKRLTVSSDRREAYRIPGVADVGSASGKALELRELAFDAEFNMRAPLPTHRWVDADGSIKAMTPVIFGSDPLYRDRHGNRDQIDAYLRQLIAARLKGRESRQLAYELFQSNRFEASYDHPFCEDPGWPCLELGDDAARTLAESLFPEILYPAMTLPTLLQRTDGTGRLVDAPDEPGKPPQPRYSSTLGRPKLFDRVLTFNLDQLEQVFAFVAAPDVQE